MYLILLLIASTFGILFGLALLVVYCISLWMVFKKLGEPGWKALIPIYNEYVLYTYVWDTNNFIIALGLSIVYSVIKEFAGDDPSMLMNILILLSGFASIFWEVRAAFYTAYSFGKSTLFGVLLYFISFIGYLILGFDASQYIGNGSQMQRR